MTVTTTDNIATYVGDGIETVFSFDFQIQEESDMTAFLDDIETFNFTTFINADQDASPGGTVTFDAPPADQVDIVLRRDVPYDQLVDYQEYGPFPAETHEGALDKLTMVDQQLQEQIDRLNLPPPGTIPPSGDDAHVAGDLTVGGTITAVGTATAAEPTIPGHLTTKLYVDDADTALKSAIAVTFAGMVGPFAAAPSNALWLYCDGTAVNRTTYAVLFAVIGTIYGDGNGSTTFNLPDYRGQFLRGQDDGQGIDPDAASRTDRGDGTTGDEVGTKQADAAETINGTISFQNSRGSVTSTSGVFSRSGTQDGAEPGNTSPYSNQVQINTALTNKTSTENRPVNTNVRHYIHSGIG